MRTILLIRHGESESNVGSPTSFPETIPLTSLGREQAKRIAEYLKSQFSLDLIITSSYQRAKQTAELTMLSFPSVPEEEWPVKEFTYLSSVHGENSTIDERRPLVEAYWNEQFIRALLWLSQRDTIDLSQETMQEFKGFLDANSLPNGGIVCMQFDNSYRHWRYEIITSHLEEQEEQKQSNFVTSGC